MKIKLLDENTFGLFNDSGVEVEKRSVTAEMRKAVTRKKSLTAVIKAALEAEGQQVADIPAELVQTSEPVTVPFHEHPYDERAAEVGHEHEYAGIDHPHPQIQVIHNALEEESRLRHAADETVLKALDNLRTEIGQVVQELRRDAAKAISDLDGSHSNSVSNLRKVVSVLEESIPRGSITQADLNLVIERVNLLTSEVTSLRQALDFERGKRAEDADRVQSYVKSEVAASRIPEGLYATKEDLGNITLRSGRFRLKVLSKQNIDGQDLLTVEEVT